VCSLRGAVRFRVMAFTLVAENRWSILVAIFPIDLARFKWNIIGRYKKIWTSHIKWVSAQSRPLTPSSHLHHLSLLHKEQLRNRGGRRQDRRHDQTIVSCITLYTAASQLPLCMSPLPRRRHLSAALLHWMGQPPEFAVFTSRQRQCNIYSHPGLIIVQSSMHEHCRCGTAFSG